MVIRASWKKKKLHAPIDFEKPLMVENIDLLRIAIKKIKKILFY